MTRLLLSFVGVCVAAAACFTLLIPYNLYSAVARRGSYS